MENDEARIQELQDILNDAAADCVNATEENLAFVHGYFVGISQGIIAMGYTSTFDQTYFRFYVEKDPLKNSDKKVYAQYTAKIIENHFSLMLKGSDGPHEQAIMDGMEEVLRIFGFKLIRDFGADGFLAVKNNADLS